MRVQFRGHKTVLALSISSLIALSACSHGTNEPRITVARAPASSLGNTTAADISADFRDPKLLDFELYKNEHWKGGSREAELDEFAWQSKEVVAAQMNLQKKRDATSGDRVFHQKQHGCLVGSLNVIESRTGASEADLSQTFQGMFDGKKTSYTVLARYSNGVGTSEHDLMPDVRGIGIKIFGVRDAKDGSEKTVDLTMTNSPVAFGDDTQEFIDFMKAKDDPGTTVAGYFITHPRVAKALLSASLKYTSSLTQTQFWAGHPYLLGQDGAIKLNIRPEKSEGTQNDTWSQHYPSDPDHKSVQSLIASWGELSLEPTWLEFVDVKKDWDDKRNYLHDDLVKRASQGEIRYILSVQLEKNDKSTPIEKNLTPWKEKASPSIAVAELVFERQTMGDSELENLCHQARFTPGHYVTQHRPLSNMGRGRIFAYRASQIARGASQDEVQESKILEIKKRITSR